MKKLILVFMAMFSVANAGEYISALVRYSGDGAVPTIMVSMPNSINDGIFLGYDAPNRLLVTGIDYETLSVFYTISPTFRRLTYANKFYIGKGYIPYLGLSLSDNNQSGLDAGLIFNIF